MTAALSSRTLSDFGRNFFIIVVLEWNDLIFGEVVAGAHLDNLDAYILVALLLVEHPFDDGLVLCLAGDEYAALAVLRLGATMDADAGTPGYVAQ